MKPYGCNNSERKPFYDVIVRGSPIIGSTIAAPVHWDRIYDTSSVDCQYRKQIMNDPRCKGCKK